MASAMNATRRRVVKKSCVNKKSRGGNATAFCFNALCFNALLKINYRKLAQLATRRLVGAAVGSA
jgi:hypothetical protein